MCEKKHGAVYDIEDLMAVTLVNDDLRSFIPRWDAVIAGMTSEPDVMWKQTLFHNAIKNFKPLSHDLAVYDRILEGEPNCSYDFVMKAARDYLEKMRQATKKSLSGRKDAAAATPRQAKALEFVMISKPENALEEKSVSTNTRNLRKAKGVRRASLDLAHELRVD